MSGRLRVASHGRRPQAPAFRSRACGETPAVWAAHCLHRKRTHRPGGPIATRGPQSPFRFHNRTATPGDSLRHLIPENAHLQYRENRGNRTFTILPLVQDALQSPENPHLSASRGGFHEISGAPRQSPANPHLSLLCGKSPIDSGTYDVHIKRIVATRPIPKFLTLDARNGSPGIRPNSQTAPGNAHLSVAERDEVACCDHRLLCFCGERTQITSRISSP
jgi:hypothetical protein